LFSDDFDFPRWVSAFGISALIDALPAPPPASTLVALFPTIEAAADVAVSIVTVLRLSMLELMDNGSINAVEDLVTMGLDRSAGALLLARSDAPGAAATQEIEAIRAAYDRTAPAAGDEGDLGRHPSCHRQLPGRLPVRSRERARVSR
jgi:FAD/FMN-containing dehydrogenase